MEPIDRRRLQRQLQDVLGPRLHIFSDEGGVVLQIRAALLLERGPRLRAAAPLRGLVIHGASRAHLADLGRGGLLDGLAHVGLYEPAEEVQPEDIAAFVSRLRAPERLALPGVGEVGAEAISRLPSLTTLELGQRSRWTGRPIGAAGLRRLSRLPALRDLTLSDQQVGERDWAALSGGPLERLQVSGERLGEAPRLALRALRLMRCEVEHLAPWLGPALEALSLIGAPALDRSGLRALHGGALRDLSLVGDVLDLDALGGVRLPALERLRLNTGFQGDARLAALRYATGLSPRALDLSYVGEPGAGLARALGGPFGARLRSLELSGLSESGWLQVARARPLTHFGLSEADFHLAHLDAYLQSDGHRLETLDLEATYGCSQDRVLAWAARAPTLRLQGLEAKRPQRADLLALAANPAARCLRWVSLSFAEAFDDDVAQAWAGSAHLAPELELKLSGDRCTPRARAALERRFGERLVRR